MHKTKLFEDLQVVIGFHTSQILSIWELSGNHVLENLENLEKGDLAVFAQFLIELY